MQSKENLDVPFPYIEPSWPEPTQNQISKQAEATYGPKCKEGKVNSSNPSIWEPWH